MAENDLSKIVGLIMENPQLMEEIRNITEAHNEASESEKPKIEAESVTTEPKKANVPERATYEPKRDSKRTELLRALKPYLSEERGQAIESMLTIADILSVMRER